MAEVKRKNLDTKSPAPVQVSIADDYNSVFNTITPAPTPGRIVDVFLVVDRV